MKKVIIIIYFIFLAIQTNAQQWVDKLYTYDSITDITYGTAINFNGGIDTLKMDIFLPKCDDTFQISRRPLLLVIHGGAFLAGNRYDANTLNITKDFAKRGYVTATIEYRLGFIADNNAWTCNFPNYSCVFAADTAEWIRSCYRAIQDGKGALRYLINRNQQFRIDTSNIFVTGESAGSFVAMGIAYADTAIEKPLEAGGITAVLPPNTTSLLCPYNIGKNFGTTIARPDLGNIDGDIEPTTIQYKIKAVGNNFGAIQKNLFLHTKANTSLPSLYLYHQPCDIVVPSGFGKIYEGLSWCLANCYNCYGIINTPYVMGSQAIKDLITTNNYPIQIYNDITSNTNPYNCLFGSYSCTDQINNPCHSFDNYTTRTTNMANFFASKITTSPICIPNYIPNETNTIVIDKYIHMLPNPFTSDFNIENLSSEEYHFNILDLYGHIVYTGLLRKGTNHIKFNAFFAKGVYIIKGVSKSHQFTKSILKN